MMGSHISYTPRHFYFSRFGKGADDQCAKFGADPSCPPAGVDYVLVLQNRRQLTFRHLADRPGAAVHERLLWSDRFSLQSSPSRSRRGVSASVSAKAVNGRGREPALI